MTRRVSRASGPPAPIRHRTFLLRFEIVWGALRSPLALRDPHYRRTDSQSSSFASFSSAPSSSRNVFSFSAARFVCLHRVCGCADLQAVPYVCACDDEDGPQPPREVSRRMELFGVRKRSRTCIDSFRWGGRNPFAVYYHDVALHAEQFLPCLLYTSPSPRDLSTSRMPSSA